MTESVEDPESADTKVRLKGGTLYLLSNKKNQGPVDEATVTKDGEKGEYVIALKHNPIIAPFEKGDHLIYNTKGTTNPNADNAVTVTKVHGPGKYKCTGGWPVNI